MRDREDVDWDRWLARFPEPTSDDEIEREIVRLLAEHAWSRKEALTSEIRRHSLTLASPPDDGGGGTPRLALFA
ncbi:hypothetical protein [Frankia nepalensis]|uniref:Uncharacterized protein n=1 Tax=Frankia nepalensis TaxID=1836974 RepID=A0A937RSI4_9ACTN|nr:hypothetical protein [Frankia nepalensis]MBL7495708.1 hypothetical protein [Frankia nepalensis]MBL7511365.1 hypothetical protein [Frankia nepalensis]MBL7631136.1 hypothetical protein [Frankia nepalensis]